MSLARVNACALVGWLSLSGLALGDPPSLSHTTPLAVLPGTATDLTFHGGALANSTGIWTSFTSAAALTPDVPENNTQAAQVRYRVETPTDTPVGVAGIRVATTEGISNLRLLMVDDLASVAENGQNGAFENAQVITVPLAVDGKIDAEQSDFYRFHATAGARISVEAVARRLGFALDPVVRLLDAAGRELVYADDDPSLGPDCRFAYVVPAEGDYTLEVRDIRYQGGEQHRYRLRIGNFPLVSTTFPLAARKGRENQLHVDGMGPMTLALAADCTTSAVPMGVKLPDGAGSTAVTVASSDWDEATETEPNDAPDVANVVALPGALNGRADHPRDRDTFTFHAPADARYLIRVQTRSLGSPADVSLRIVNADGAQLMELENAGGNDREAEFKAPAEGDYRLVVEELYRRAGSDFTYRVELLPFEPGFTLTTDAEKWDVPRGGVFVTKVTAARREYNGPITLSVEGLGEGLQLAGNQIAEGQNETVLQVTLPEAIEPGRFSSVRIVGRAQVGDKQLVATAQSRPLLTAALSGLAYPPATVNGALGLGVGPVFPDFFKLALDRGSIPFPRLIGASSFTVKTERLNGFEDAVALSVEGLPPGMSADVKPLEKGQNEVALTLTGPSLLSEGPYTVRVVGQATFKNQPKRVVLDEVPLRVVDPLQAGAELPAPLTAGASSPLKVRVTRFGDAAPVRVSLAKLPAGVTTSSEVTVAPDQQEIELPLTAAADAAPGDYADVELIATSEVKGLTVLSRTQVTITVAAKME